MYWERNESPAAKRALLATHKPPPHQAAVDAAQEQIRADLKAGRRSLFKPAQPPLEPSSDILDQRLAEELGFVVRTLEHLGAALSEDPILLRRYGLQLQSIDLVKQVLTNVGRIVATRDRAAAVEQVSLSDLKARLQRKKLRSVTE